MDHQVTSTYPLTGLRTASVEPQQALVYRVVEVLEPDPRVLAGYLVGGFAVGQGDAFSDVDLQIVVDDDAMAELADSWPDLLDLFGAARLTSSRSPGRSAAR